MRIYIFLIAVTLIGSLGSSRSRRQLNVKCKNNPCFNGGKCIQVGKNLAYCACYPGFFGKDCSLSSTTTRNIKTPFDPNQFYLACPQNVPNPCLNGGKCFYTTISKTIQCECRPGYTDTFCMNSQE